MMVIFNKNFIKTIDKAVNILYNIIVRGVFYNKKDHLFASTRGECSTNIPQINSDDTQRKSLINQVKFLPTFKIPLKIMLSK